MSETFQRPDKSFFQNPKELEDLINEENLVHKYLPKQTDIDKIQEVIQRKVLKKALICLWKLKKFKQDICVAHIFKDLYLYLLQNKLPSSKLAMRKLETIAEKICLTRFIIVQNFSRKGDSSSSNTKDMCR